jgi:hypothetical protein
MLDAVLRKTVALVCLLVEPNHHGDPELFEYGHVVLWGEGTHLQIFDNWDTPSESLGVGDGPLNETNFWGTVQLRSPFSTLS